MDLGELQRIGHDSRQGFQHLVGQTVCLLISDGAAVISFAFWTKRG